MSEQMHVNKGAAKYAGIVIQHIVNRICKYIHNDLIYFHDNIMWLDLPTLIFSASSAWVVNLVLH